MTAVDDVSFTIAPGAAVGLVGASGSGKSTLAKLITGSERPSRGTIRFGDLAVERLRSRRLRQFHSRVQMVFQDPYGALNPLHTVEYTVMRPVPELPGPVRGAGAAGGSTNCSKRSASHRPASSPPSCRINSPAASGSGSSSPARLPAIPS